MFGIPRQLSVKESTASIRDQGDAGLIPDQVDLLEEKMAAHSSILAWRIPGTEEPGRLQSIGSQSRTRLKQLSMHTHTYY